MCPQSERLEDVKVLPTDRSRYGLTGSGTYSRGRVDLLLGGVIRGLHRSPNLLGDLGLPPLPTLFLCTLDDQERLENRKRGNGKSKIGDGIHGVLE